MKVLIILILAASTLSAEPKQLTADKANEHSRLIIRLQAKQLEFFAVKDQVAAERKKLEEQIDVERKKFERQVEDALAKKVADFEQTKAEYQKFVDAQRTEAGAAKECTLDDQAAWKCPAPEVKK